MKKFMAIMILAFMAISTPAAVMAQAVMKARLATGNHCAVRADANCNLLTGFGTTPGTMTFDADAPGNCRAITNASVAFVLPTTTDTFRICAYGNEAYIIGGAAPVATLVVTTGYSARVKDGQCLTQTITEAQIAVIAVATAGAICFNPLVPTP